jgi:curved DNA-binding protein CbpA
MKSIDELDYYEVLELRPGARGEENERAYQLTRAAYADGSMALYSLFSSADAEAIRGRIDEAYRILGNPDDRKSYDVATGHCSETTELPDDPMSGQASVSTSLSSGVSTVSGTVATVIDVFEELDAEIDEDEHEFGGAALRRARLRRGVELAAAVLEAFAGRIPDSEDKGVA